MSEGKQFYEDNGFYIIKGFLNKEELENARQFLSDMEAAPEQRGDIWKYFDKDEVIERIEHFEAKMPKDLREKCKSSVEELVGEEVFSFKEKVNFKKPGTGFFAPHQDAQAGWDQYGHSIHYNIGVALDDCTLENGALFVAPGEHKRGLIGPTFGAIPEENLKPLKWVSCECSAGDAIFFDSYIPHKSEINKTDKQRRLVLMTYNKKSEGDARKKYHDDKLQGHPPRVYKEDGKKYRGYVI